MQLMLNHTWCTPGFEELQILVHMYNAHAGVYINHMVGKNIGEFN